MDYFFNYLIKISLPFFRVHEQPQEDADAPPEFLSPLEDLVLAENSLAHFETRLTPINDPSMKVEWFHNGKQLSAGSRIKTINDFGFVILEVANVMTRDSGNYTCKVIIVLQKLDRNFEFHITIQSRYIFQTGIGTQKYSTAVT